MQDLYWKSLIEAVCQTHAQNPSIYKYQANTTSLIDFVTCTYEALLKYLSFVPKK